MKIIVAPNSLKGSLTAQLAAQAIAQGVKKVLPKSEVLLHPIADGGDGFAEVLCNELQAEKNSIAVTGPLGGPVNAPIYYSKNNSVAIIEMATIAGLTLVSPQNRNPLLTTTRGVGEAIKIALDAGVERILIGLGGSATNDAGIGMASVLGARFLDKEGNTVDPIGRSLAQVVAIDTSGMDARLQHVTIDVACDVDNPFFGENGAAHVFASQKGATSDQVIQLDQGMQSFAKVILNTFKIDINNYPGTGAAGGLAAALMIFCKAHLARGIDIVLDTIKFNNILQNASLVLTAEGQFDSQTRHGKAPTGVAKRAARSNIPCIVLAGSADTKSIDSIHSDITAAVSICPGPVNLDTSMKNAFDYLSDTAEQITRIFVAGRDNATSRDNATK